MSSSEYAKRLQKLLKKLKPHAEVPEASDRNPVQHLIHAFMVWNASQSQADKAYESMLESVVDLNDLRVSDPIDIVEMIGSKYPLAEVRAHRLKMALHGVYVAEHATELKSLGAKSKKDARQFLVTLDGMVPFVASSVVLLSLGGHAIPVDDDLLDRLKEDGVVDPDMGLEGAQAYLEHQVKASQSLETYYMLRSYVEQSVKSGLPKLPPQKGKKASSKKIIPKKAAVKKVAAKKAAASKAVVKNEVLEKKAKKAAKKTVKKAAKKTVKKAAKKTVKKAAKKTTKKAAKKTVKKKAKKK